MCSTACANPNAEPSDGSKTTTLLSGRAFELAVRVRNKKHFPECYVLQGNTEPAVWQTVRLGSQHNKSEKPRQAVRYRAPGCSNFTQKVRNLNVHTSFYLLAQTGNTQIRT